MGEGGHPIVLCTSRGGLTSRICLIKVSEAFSDIFPTNTVVATFIVAVELGTGTFYNEKIL